MAIAERRIGDRRWLEDEPCYAPVNAGYWITDEPPLSRLRLLYTDASAPVYVPSSLVPAEANDAEPDLESIPPRTMRGLEDLGALRGASEDSDQVYR